MITEIAPGDMPYVVSTAYGDDVWLRSIVHYVHSQKGDVAAEEARAALLEMCEKYTLVDVIVSEEGTLSITPSQYDTLTT